MNNRESTFHSRAVLLGGLGAFLIVFVIGRYALAANVRALQWWTDTAWTIAYLAGALKAFHTMRGMSGPKRTAWLFIGLGWTSWSGHSHPNLA